MSSTAKPRWEKKRTDDSRLVEQALQKVFARVDAYRYNSASIRVRVIDPRFAGKTREVRDRMVERLLDKLPAAIQADIVNLLTIAPDELRDPTSRQFLLNAEFDDPSPSRL